MRSAQDLLAERRACALEAARSTDAMTRAMLQGRIAELDAQIKAVAK